MWYNVEICCSSTNLLNYRNSYFWKKRFMFWFIFYHISFLIPASHLVSLSFVVLIFAPSLFKSSSYPWHSKLNLKIFIPLHKQTHTERQTRKKRSKIWRKMSIINRNCLLRPSHTNWYLSSSWSFSLSLPKLDTRMSLKRKTKVTSQ